MVLRKWKELSLGFVEEGGGIPPAQTSKAQVPDEASPHQVTKDPWNASLFCMGNGGGNGRGHN